MNDFVLINTMDRNLVRGLSGSQSCLTSVRAEPVEAFFSQSKTLRLAQGERYCYLARE